MGFAVATLALSMGIRLDNGSFPGGVWSFDLLALGACLAIAVSQGAASVYREYRRRNSRD